MAIGLLTLALVGTLGLAGTVLLGHRVAGHVSPVSAHFLLALGTTTLLVMAHSFILFFLIATGVELKDMEKEGGWGDSFRRRTIGLKNRCFPLVSAAILLVMATFIMGAAAHTRVIPGWAHGLLAWSTLLVCLLTLQREWEVLGDNNRLIDEAAQRRRAPRDSIPEGVQIPSP